MRPLVYITPLLALALLLGAATRARSEPTTEAPPRTDYLVAAQGAWLASVSFTGAKKGPSHHTAFETYDGLTTRRIMLVQGDHDARLELIYELPALTTSSARLSRSSRGSSWPKSRPALSSAAILCSPTSASAAGARWAGDGRRALSLWHCQRFQPLLRSVSGVVIICASASNGACM